MKIFFAFGPRKDNLREEIIKGLLSTDSEEKESPPATYVVKEVKKYNPNLVLFFGIAGSLNPKIKINSIVFPNKFSKLFLNTKYFLYKQDINPESTIKINNLFGNDDIHVLTTNLFLDQSKMGAGSNMKLWKKYWSEISKDLKKYGIKSNGKKAIDKWTEIKYRKYFIPKLRKFGDIMEMESYYFAKSFKRIGIMLQVSDIIGETKLERKIIDWKKFSKNVIEKIKEKIKTG